MPPLERSVPVDRGEETRKDFESLALPHVHDLYRTARRVVGDPATAEDLVQEAYLNAWKSFHRFEPGTNCRAWLFKILFHGIHHHRRKWFHTKARETDEILENTMAYESPIPERITDEEVLAALERLSPEFREVVLLADVEELSYRDVAETLKIPVGTVMSRLSRARRQLRKELALLAASMGIGDPLKGNAS